MGNISYWPALFPANKPSDKAQNPTHSRHFFCHPNKKTHSFSFTLIRPRRPLPLSLSKEKLFLSCRSRLVASSAAPRRRRQRKEEGGRRKEEKREEHSHGLFFAKAIAKSCKAT